jgi:hypothetical protein
MAITVNFDGITATINEGEWSTDKDTDFKGVFETVLNTQLEVDIATGEYGTVVEPDVDLRSATLMDACSLGRLPTPQSTNHLNKVRRTEEEERGGSWYIDRNVWRQDGSCRRDKRRTPVRGGGELGRDARTARSQRTMTA